LLIIYSTDKTFSILQDLAETDKNIRLIQIKNHSNSHCLVEEDADFRYLHTCFIPRSGQEGDNRINPYEIPSEYKLEKYVRGEIIEKGISSFLK